VNPRRAFFIGTISGSAALCAIYSLLMDYLGQRGYAHYVETHWTRAVYTVPCAVCCLLIFVGAFLRVWTSPSNDVSLGHPLPRPEMRTPPPQHPAERAADEVARSGSWGWGVGREQRKVVLKFGSAETKSVIQFELDPMRARMVAQAILDEADDAERPDAATKRPTSWAKLDDDNFEDKKHGRPKAPDWPK
jgi:hypothetical protein